jgi:hypothetical protein
MKPTLPVAIILALGCLATSLAAAPEDMLWRKALAVAASNTNWLPGLIITRTEMLQKGKVAGVHEVWRRSNLGAKGEVVTTTVKVLEDGKDVTAKEKKEMDAKGGPKKEKLGGHPFDLNLQDHLSLKRTDQTRIVSGRNCVGYEFDLRNTNGVTVKGTTWLEKETGWPAEIENMTINPLPEKRFKRMTTTTRYASSPEGRWQIKEVITTGAVSVLFIKADIRSTTTFNDYWQKPARTDRQTN